MPTVEFLEPPKLELTAELDWTLAATFSRTAPAAPDALTQRSIERCAVELGLAERLAARPAANLLDEAIRDVLHRHLVRSAAVCLMYEHAASRVATIASHLDIPVVFLKGFALSRILAPTTGARPFADLDLLVRDADASTLHAALVDDGFRPHPDPATEQHLPILSHPRRGAVEVHFQLRGLRRTDGQAMTLDDLEARGALTPLQDLPGLCTVPVRSALGAHLLVHGLQQHLLRPHSYPLFRMVGDLVDLLPAEGDWARMLERWGDAIAPSVSSDLVAATRALVECLQAGKARDLDLTSPGGILLRHLVAGAVEREYAASLAPKYLAARLAEARGRGELFSYLWRKVAGRTGSAGGARSDDASAATGLRRRLAALLGALRLLRPRGQHRESGSDDALE
jgi:hypothetical protein